MFKDKVVWITGASNGIGKALALQVALNGAKVVLSSRHVTELNEVHADLPDPDKHLVLEMDLEEQGNFKDLVVQVIEHYGHIHYVFNNAGISQRSTAHDTQLKVDRRIMEINYFGNIALAKAVLPVFRAQGFGHFLITSSVTGKFGFYERSAYAASKHALHGFYESLLLEEEKNGISVTMACPGKVRTNISLNALEGDGVHHGKYDRAENEGVSAEDCAKQMLEAVLDKKFEVLIGKEVKAITLRRFSSSLFWKTMRKRSAR